MKNKEKLILYIWLVALIFIVLVGIILVWQRPSSEVISASKELMETSEKIRTYYSNRPEYWGLDTYEAISKKLYSGKITNNQIINNFGKPVVIGADVKGTPISVGMRGFTITYQHLTQDECVGLTSFNLSEKEKLGLMSVTIQSEKGIYRYEWGEKELPLSHSRARRSCGENNDILWSFE